jgi:hypothetical protein
MKTILTTAAFVLALGASTAFAGGVAEPAMPEIVIVEDATDTSGHIIVPLMFLLLVAAQASS